VVLVDIGAIVGGVVGGVLGAAILGALAFFYWRKKRQPKASALDEKMVSLVASSMAIQETDMCYPCSCMGQFDPSHTTRHSGGPNMPVDLIGDGYGATGGSQISPYTSGMGSKAGAAGWAGGAAATAGLAATGAGAGAYQHNRQHSREPSDPRYAYPSRGSFDSTVYSGTTDPYMNNMAGMGAGMAAGANGARTRAAGYPDGYGSNSGHDNGYYATTPQSPENNRRSGGWGVAAAMGNDMGGAGGYSSRDYATGGYPRDDDDYSMPSPPVSAVGNGSNRNRMSASAMAKLREARGEAPYPDREGNDFAAGPVGSHGRRPSSQGLSSYDGPDDQVDDYCGGGGNHIRRSSNGLSRTSEGDHTGRGSLVVHDDGGPIPEDEERGTLPGELPPT
jgi:hypothetical protein